MTYTLDEHRPCKEQLDAALARYDAEVMGRREEVTACHAVMGKLRAENERLARERDEARAAAKVAEREQIQYRDSLAAANALHDQSVNAHAAAVRDRGFAELRLAAANALLDRIVKYAREDKARTSGLTRLARALDEAVAHLAGQPAAPTRTEAIPDVEIPGPNDIRTAAEQCVLETARAVPESTLAFWRATRHIRGFDPAVEFLDAVVLWRQELETSGVASAPEHE